MRKAARKTATNTVVVIGAGADFRDGLVERLRELGFIGIPAATLESGIVIVRKLPVDLLVIESAADDISGISQIFALKRRKGQIAIVAITDRHPVSEGLFRSAGCDEVFYRPVVMAELLERIQLIVRRAPPTRHETATGSIDTGRRDT